MRHPAWFTSPALRKDACAWLRAHELDPGDVDEVVELRPGLFHVGGPVLPIVFIDQPLEEIVTRWWRRVVSEHPCPGLQ